jgi:hypothetical protein
MVYSGKRASLRYCNISKKFLLHVPENDGPLNIQISLFMGFVGGQRLVAI